MSFSQRHPGAPHPGLNERCPRRPAPRKVLLLPCLPRAWAPVPHARPPCLRRRLARAPARLPHRNKMENNRKTDPATALLEVEVISDAKHVAFCRLGMDGLEAAEGSSSGSSDDDSEETPGTSGLSCSAPESGSDDVEVAAESPQSSGGLSTDLASLAKPQSPVTDSGQDILEDGYSELGDTCTKEHRTRKMVRETEEPSGRNEAERPKPTEKDIAGAGLKKTEETEGMTDKDRVAVVTSEEDREISPISKLEEASHPGDAVLGRGAVDLLAFSSAAELELLGLERLKCELMALGLKCGGTLQERAARLFSVRGLAKEHIDPALFAKPSKGKKK
uniref:replication stress response regulator SDE2 n=1 Tax=Jaculus jaculus TaxID=51337 RepID=UPI001E1B5257|nr:replication stress response regulator SDE2 [Jaculus jaculus]